MKDGMIGDSGMSEEVATELLSKIRKVMPTGQANVDNFVDQASMQKYKIASACVRVAWMILGDFHPEVLTHDSMRTLKNRLVAELGGKKH